MTEHVDRALLLYQQSKYEAAEEEARQALLQDVHDPMAHCVLALCLSERQAYDDATREAQQAIGTAPDSFFTHYTLGRVMYERNRFPEAQAAMEQAIELNPQFDDGFSMLAAIHFDQKSWQQALDAADQGLAIDPDNTGCLNLRAMSLRQLGRHAESQSTIEGALSKAPDNAVSHANQGWALLEAGKHQEAMNHFREALRLDPVSEYARVGILEAMKARNIVYRVLLKFFLFMGKLSDKAQWAVIIGLFLGMRVLRTIARSNPEFQPFVIPILVLYFAFCILTWIAHPLFNLVLRLDKFGRLVLSREEILASNLVGVCIVAALALLALGLTLSFNGASGANFLFGAAVAGLMVVPVSGVFQCELGWPRRSMTIYTSVLAALAILGILLVALGLNLGGLFLFVALIGIFLFSWVGNAVGRARPVR